MLMVKLYFLICPIKTPVIIVLSLKEKAIFNGTANGQNTDPERVTFVMF